MIRNTTKPYPVLFLHHLNLKEVFILECFLFWKFKFKVNSILTWVIHRLTYPIVFPCQPKAGKFYPDPGTEQSLNEVVDNLNLVDVVGLPVPHKSRTSYPDDEEVENTDGCCRPWGWHKNPIIHSKAVINNLISTDQLPRVSQFYK